MPTGADPGRHHSASAWGKAILVLGLGTLVAVTPSLVLALIALILLGLGLGRVFSESWSIRDVVLVFILEIGGYSVIGLFEALVRREDDSVSVMWEILTDSAVTVFVVWVILRLVTKRYREPIASVGITRKAFMQNARWGVAIAAPLLGLTWGIDVVMGRLFGPGPFVHPVVEMVGSTKSGIEMCGVFVLVSVLTPIEEEIVLRGFTFSTLRARWGLTTAVVVSSAFFTILHGNPVWFPSMFCFGVTLALLYHRTRSLVGPIVAHAVFNAVVVASMYAERFGLL